MIYAAYGSNLNHIQMKKRCPKARFLGAGKIEGYRLVFRGVADIERDESDFVNVGLWDITKDCLVALDRYEGFPKLYDRKTFTVQTDNGAINAMAYFMLADGYAYPNQFYYEIIQMGYQDCNLPEDDLREAMWETVYALEKR